MQKIKIGRRAKFRDNFFPKVYFRFTRFYALFSLPVCCTRYFWWKFDSFCWRMFLGYGVCTLLARAQLKTLSSLLNCSKRYLLAELVHFFFLPRLCFTFSLGGSTEPPEPPLDPLLSYYWSHQSRGACIKYKIRSLWNSRVRKNWWLLEDRRNLAYTGT